MKLNTGIFQKHYKVVVVLLIAVIGISNSTTENSRYFEISKNIEIFTNLYKEINTYYVDDVDPAKLMRTGIDAMLESLDPYTNYISESEIEGFRMTITGKYGGIGASVIKHNDNIVIANPYEGFAAHKAGLKSGDIILSIDGKSAVGKNTDAVTDILKGSPGTTVAIEVQRPGSNKPMKIDLVREEIQVSNVPYYGMVSDDIGYITLTTFTDDSGKNVAEALNKLKAEHDLKGVILDLRYNGGGLLSEAINVSNVFVNKGEDIVMTKGKVKEWDRGFKTLNNPEDLDIPLAVLINNSSASASEIVSGVIQDLDRGVLIGQKSYGKGLVQNTKDVGYNSRVKITIAKYYIPSGRCIQSVSYKDGEPVDVPEDMRGSFKTRNGRPVHDGGGVKPDVKIEGPANASIIRTLSRKHIIFDYATNYALKNPSISPAKEFSLTDADFTDFVAFANSQDYKYETQSEKALKALEERAKKEKYFDAIESDLADMKTKISADKAKDMYKFKSEIMDLLEREITSRYYLDKGRIEVGLKNDEEVAEAIKILGDKARYNEILGN